MKSKLSKQSYILIAVCLVCVSLLILAYTTNGLNKTISTLAQRNPMDMVSQVVERAINDEGIGWLGLGTYKSTFGIQGFVCYFLAKILPSDIINQAIILLSSSLMAVVAVAICYQIRKYCDILLAVIFFIVFLMSPWIISFSREMYWAVFSWYIPMLVGLFYVNKKFANVKVYYLLMFFAVLLKSLCSYEFLSTVLITAMAFPFAHIINTYFTDKSNFYKEFRTVFFMGVFALLGVLVAMVIHCVALGEGNFFEGFQYFYKISVYRTFLVDEQVLLDFGLVEGTDGFNIMMESYNVSVLWVLDRYSKFYTDVIYFLPANMFRNTAALVLVIVTGSAIIKKKITKNFVLYFTFLASTVSWLVLAKPHAYLHAHIDYTLWYMGFVQIIFYILISVIYKMCIDLYACVKLKMQNK